jgi:hypothetical protein
MTTVSVGDHLWVKVSRRSLCDNCIADVCLVGRDARHECDSFQPPFLAIRLCDKCGRPYDVFENHRELDLHKCRECNS